MKCGECVAAGEKSRVVIHGQSSTLMKWDAYYDEEGVFHAHDPNKVVSRYSCSRGHNWETQEPAPACACGWSG